MSSPTQIAGVPHRHSRRWDHLPSFHEAFASLLRTIVVALFLLTFRRGLVLGVRRGEGMSVNCTPF